MGRHYAKRHGLLCLYSRGLPRKPTASSYRAHPSRCINWGVFYQIAQELRPGDLVFFKDTFAGAGISHVGVYLGDGEFAHASSVKASRLRHSTIRKLHQKIRRRTPHWTLINGTKRCRGCWPSASNLSSYTSFGSAICAHRSTHFAGAFRARRPVWSCRVLDAPPKSGSVRTLILLGCSSASLCVEQSRKPLRRYLSLRVGRPSSVGRNKPLPLCAGRRLVSELTR